MPKPRVVAVVDDDFRVLESLEDLLESAGYVAHGFSSGRAILASPVWHTLNLLIADIRMADVDGFALCRRLQSERSGTAMFFITGSEEAFQEAKGLRIPIFFKPLNAELLLLEIARSLDRFL